MIILFFLQLNEVLTPNPFHRPGAVFLLEVGGFDGLCSRSQSAYYL